MPVAARAKTVGKPAALDMALRGKLLDADEAERIGLIHQACATVEELEEATLELALELGGKAPLAMQGVLQAIMEGSVRSPPTDHPFRRKSWRLFWPPTRGLLCNCCSPQVTLAELHKAQAYNLLGWQQELPVLDGIEVEYAAQRRSAGSEDAKEGVAAFLSKPRRDPVWKGR